MLASGLLFAYLVVWMIELASLGTSDDAFGRMQGWAASLPGRILAGLVWTAAVYHGLEGVRTALRGERASVAVAVLPGGDVPAGSALRSGAEQPLGLSASAEPSRRIIDGEANNAFGAGVLTFLTWALVLPGWVLVLRPWIEDLLR